MINNKVNNKVKLIDESVGFMKKGNLVNIYISLDEQEDILGTSTFYWLDRI